MSDFNKEQAYKKAKKRLNEERGFYVHVGTYVIMNIALIFFKFSLNQYIDNEEFNNWLFWNIILTPILWGLGLFGHGLWTFRRKIKWFRNSIYSKQWEQRKIKEIMKEDDF